MLPIYLHNSTNQVQKNHGSSCMQYSNQEKVVSQILGVGNDNEKQNLKLLHLLPDNATSTPASTTTVDVRPQSKWCQNTKSLGLVFVPSENDVICGRGKAVWNHPGNKYFRALVKDTTTTYSKAKNKAERSVVVSDVVDIIRARGSGFVKKEKDGQWIEVGELLAREKVGQMLRNTLSSKYRSSVASKKHRRRKVQAKSIDMLHAVMESNTTVKKSMDTIQLGTANGNLSDEAILALFVQQQSNMLNVFKNDSELVDKFHQAEVTACLVLNDDDDSSTDEDGDAEMKAI